jgi:hypothetical protein
MTQLNPWNPKPKASNLIKQLSFMGFRVPDKRRTCQSKELEISGQKGNTGNSPTNTVPILDTVCYKKDTVCY